MKHTKHKNTKRNNNVFFYVFFSIAILLTLGTIVSSSQQNQKESFAAAGTCIYSENDKGTINCYDGTGATGFNNGCHFDAAVGVQKVTCPAANTASSGNVDGCTYSQNDSGVIDCYEGMNSTGKGFNNSCVFDPKLGVKKVTCPVADTNIANKTAPAANGIDGCTYSQKNSNGTTSCYIGMNDTGKGFNNNCLYDPKLGVKPAACPGSTAIVPGSIDGCIYSQKNTNGTSSCFIGKNSSGTGFNNSCVFDPLLGAKPVKCPGATSIVPVTHTSINLRAHVTGIGHGTNTYGTPENSNPKQPLLHASLKFLPPQNTQQIVITGTLTYNPQTGDFENSNFDTTSIPSGIYKVLLHVDNYLDALLVTRNTIQTITVFPENTDTPLPVSLNPGDIAPNPHGDNIIDIQDYNTVVGCLTKANTAVCPNIQAGDLNSDGVVDQKDLDLVEGNFGSIGSSFSTPQFMCAQDPSCAVGSNSLQLCPLQCKIQNVPGQ